MEIPQQPLPNPPLQGEGAAPIEQSRFPFLRKNVLALLGLVIGLGVLLVGSFAIAGRVPSNFQPGTTIAISQNSSTEQIAELLVSKNIIRSSSVFKILIEILNKPVIAGQFEFDTPENIFQVVETMTGGNFGRAQIKITIPEGSNNNDISKIVLKQIPNFNAIQFLKDASQDQGVLFPETYLVFKTITPDELIVKMNQEFAQKIISVKSDISSSGHSEHDIVIMASVLEKEAKNATDAQVIAGILWKRILIGMPLQVDAAPSTYTHKGLPTTPINNPGLAMINAAIHPTTSPYLYYLYDKKGIVHYAKTYSEHQVNISKYLK